MGLAGPSKRRKIAKDPNNTNWSNDETSFGRKILASHGWTPGSYLGAKDAAHADHYSAANASHIRILLKEDTLGLGAKRGRADDSTFGLFALQDIYGRLNGKTEVELVKEQVHRADLGRKLYAEQKWGPSRFVRGGFLVGDKIEDLPKALEAESKIAEETSASAAGVAEAGADSSSPNKKGTKKKGTKKNTCSKVVDETILDETATSAMSDGASTAEEDVPETKEERRKRKLERRQRKAERRARKEARRAAKSSDMPAKAISEVKILQFASPPVPVTTPSVAFNNRNSVRSRFIKQKRMSSMDPQALREILMLKG